MCVFFVANVSDEQNRPLHPVSKYSKNIFNKYNLF